MNLEAYEELIKDKKCYICGHMLPAEVEHKPHFAGWIVDGFKEKQWLFVTCTGCGNEFSLGKLGVPKESV